MKTTQRIQRIYYGLLSLFWLGTALPMALTVLLMQARGLTLFQVGLLSGIYSLTIVLLEVPTGGLADAIGRKQVAVAAYSCLTFASVVALFAFSFPIFLIVFVLNGIGRALASGALDAWFVDTLQSADPGFDLQPALSKAGTFALLSLGLGTLGGSLLPQMFKGLPEEGTAIFTPLTTPFVLSIVIRILLVVLTIWWVDERGTSVRTSNWKQGFRQVPLLIRTGFTLSRRNPTILLLLGASLASGLALASLENFWQPQFAGLLSGSEGNSFIFGLVMGGNFLVGMVGNLLSTSLSRWLNRRYGLVCAVSQGLWGVSVILLALQTKVPSAILFFWMAYMNLGIVDSPHTTLLNQEIPSAQRSAMLSIASLAGYVGSMVGGVGLGYVAEHFSISTAWIVSGLILVVSLGLYWRVDIRSAGHPLHLAAYPEET